MKLTTDEAIENSKPHKYKVIQEMVVEVEVRDEFEATELAENKFANGEYEIYPYIEKVE